MPPPDDEPEANSPDVTAPPLRADSEFGRHALRQWIVIVDISHLLQAVPPLAAYLVVAGIVGMESLGIPLPGETVLVAAALLASQDSSVNPLLVGLGGIAGAVAGDSVGYLLGRRLGGRLLRWAGRRFPRHVGAERVAGAERIFERYGAWAVFFGRFIAILRILAGPVAGTLRMPYPRFLFANALGGVVWAGGVTTAVYFLGELAETWLRRLSWVALVGALLVGAALAVLLRRRLARAMADEQNRPAYHDAAHEPDQ